MAAQPHNFYKSELSRILRENSFGLRSYQILPDVDNSTASAQATARVELLEGSVVYLRLTYVGYEV